LAVQRVFLEGNGDGVPLHHGFLEPYRRHRPFAHCKVPVVNPQAPFGIEGEKPFVEAQKTVALCHVALHGRLPQAETQGHAQLRGEVPHSLEQQPVLLLPLRARIVYKPGPRPEAPLPAPLVAYNRPDAPSVAVVDSKSLLCHNCLFFLF
jgi:hypothetical protein